MGVGGDILLFLLGDIFCEEEELWWLLGVLIFEWVMFFLSLVIEREGLEVRLEGFIFFFKE